MSSPLVLAAASSGGGGMLMSLLPLVAIGVVFYFLLIRPQQKRQQQHQKLLGQIEPGDEICTIGGCIGTVVELTDDRALLELYDGTQVEYLRSAISRRIVPEGEGADVTDVTDAATSETERVTPEPNDTP